MPNGGGFMFGLVRVPKLLNISSIGKFSLLRYLPLFKFGFLDLLEAYKILETWKYKKMNTIQSSIEKKILNCGSKMNLEINKKYENFPKSFFLFETIPQSIAKTWMWILM